ncbi:hypothetical protein [Propioniciclava soli]|uniref:hypothetical protein n=1 Tax=Propioniciclava soli TaxID=2775081 RepID=UPI001E36106C|nr:hypothetical protein [Propioniciclava soli]
MSSMTPRQTAWARFAGRLLMVALVAVLATVLLALTPGQGVLLFCSVVPLLLVSAVLDAREVQTWWVRFVAVAVAGAAFFVPVAVTTGLNVVAGIGITLTVAAAFAFNQLFDRLGRRPRPGDLQPPATPGPTTRRPSTSGTTAATARPRTQKRKRPRR